MSLRNNTYISVSLVGDKDIKKLNKKYLNKSEPTDVLSFNIDQDMEDGKHYLGDVIVNFEQAARQAGKNGNSTKEEVSELVAHGVLHLLGVHHEDDK